MVNRISKSGIEDTVYAGAGVMHCGEKVAHRL